MRIPLNRMDSEHFEVLSFLSYLINRYYNIPKLMDSSSEWSYNDYIRITYNNWELNENIILWD